MIFGHGSSVPSANDEVRRVAADAALAGRWETFETAFLEADPRLEDAVRSLAASGAERVLVLPYFLTLGIHLRRDLPKIVDDLQARYGLPIQVAPPLDGHPSLSAILVDRAAEASR